MGDQRLTFHFHKCLGTGGFGEVYLATLTRPGGLAKRVAVKVLKQDLRHADAAVQRLRDEGRMLAILDHPCILRVLEMTLIKGRVALVTEFIDGIDMARCCRKGRLLPQSVVVGSLGEVASALHTAWTTISPETGKPLKLIHRDVKPENIRIGKHGEVKLLDFGIARTTEMFRHAKTAQGDLPFTPGYAAPEAFTKGFQGSASDIYALGVSMYRLLTGERLYEGMELSDQVTMCCLPERYAPFLRQRLDLVEAPPAILELLRDMLAYEPTHRPSAFDVEDRCATLAAELPGPSHVRWARAQEFPEPTGLPQGTLTGQTLEEDAIQHSKPKGSRGVKLSPRGRKEASRRLLDQPEGPRPQAQQENAPSAVADLTPPMAEAADPAPPPPPAVTPPQAPNEPPPVPSGIQRIQSVRPDTAPFPNPRSPSSDAGPPDPSADAPPPEPPRFEPPPSPPTPPEPAPSANADHTPVKAAPSTVDFSATLDGTEAPKGPPPPKLDTKATLDAWMHEEMLAEEGIDVEKASTPEEEIETDKSGSPPEAPVPRLTPATGARIEAPTAEPAAPRGNPLVRFVLVALALGTLVGGGMVMLGGIAVALFFVFA